MGRRLPLAILAWLLPVIAGVPLGAMAAATERLTTATAPPPGFEDLSEPQLLLVDLWSGGDPAGRVEVEVTPETVRFIDPGAATGLLRNLADRGAVIAALSGPLPSNTHLLCRETAPLPGCGRLEPEAAGVIFDEARLQLHLFLAAPLLAVEGPGTRWLPPPEVAPALLLGLGGAVSHRDGPVRSATDHSLYLQANAGWGRAHLVARAVTTDNAAPGLDTAWIGYDRGDWRYRAGVIEEQPLAPLRSGRLLGLAVGTSFDLRENAEQAAATPLSLYLPQRAQVDILRDGRLISSRQVAGGNQLLDTTALPDGAYEVTLRITDAGGTREETRFFARHHDMPPRDQPLLRLEAGVRQPGWGGGREDGPTLDGPLVVRGLAGLRLTDRLGVSALGAWEDGVGYGGLGATWVAPGLRLGARAFLSSRGDWGGTAVAGGSLFHLDWSLSVLGVDAAGDGGGRADRPAAVSRSFVQGSADLRYAGRGFSAGLRGTLRDAGGGARWSAGPFARIPLGRVGDSRLDLTLEGEHGNDGSRALVRLVLYRFGWASGWSQSGEVGYDWRSRGEDAGTDGSFAAGALAWNGAGAEGTRRAALLRAGRTGGDSRLGAAGEYQGDYGRLATHAEAAWRDGRRDLLTGGEFQATLALREGLALGGGGSGGTASAVIVQVRGASEGERFTILVDGAPAGVAPAGRPTPVPLAPYRSYRVAIAPPIGSLLELATTPRRVVLYPGSVVRLGWDVAPVGVVVARAVDPAGRAIEGARIDGAINPALTGTDGWFQVELSGAATLTLSRPDGTSCALPLPAPEGRRQVTLLAERVCAAGTGP